MTTFKKSAKAALTRGRDAAVRVGKVAKSTTMVAAKAGASAAVAAGTIEATRAWKATSPVVVKMKKRTKIAAAVAGAAVIGAAGAAMVMSRKKK
jgi:hypothetical protein